MNRLAPVVLLLAVGCTPRRQEVLAMNRGLLERLAERLRKAAPSLPPPGQTARYHSHGALDPLPRFEPAVDNRVNTDLVMAAELLDAHARGPWHVEGYHLQRILRLLAPGPEDDAALATRDPGFRDEVKHVLALRYVIVVRGGAGAPTEAFLVDISTGAIRAAVAVPELPPDAALGAIELALGRETGGQLR